MSGIDAAVALDVVDDPDVLPRPGIAERAIRDRRRPCTISDQRRDVERRGPLREAARPQRKMKPARGPRARVERPRQGRQEPKSLIRPRSICVSDADQRTSAVTRAASGASARSAAWDGAAVGRTAPGCAYGLSTPRTYPPVVMARPATIAHRARETGAISGQRGPHALREAAGRHASCTNARRRAHRSAPSPPSARPSPAFRVTARPEVAPAGSHCAEPCAERAPAARKSSSWSGSARCARMQNSVSSFPSG